MIRKLSTMPISIFVLVLVIFSVGLAQQQGHMMGDCPKEGKGKHGKMMLNLSAEQQKEMTKLKKDLLRETDPIKTEMKIKKMDLQELWQEENLDAKKILAKTKEISALKAKLQEKMVGHRLAIHQLLTPEQRKMMGKGCCGLGMHDGGGSGKGCGSGSKGCGGCQ